MVSFAQRPVAFRSFATFPAAWPVGGLALLAFGCVTVTTGSPAITGREMRERVRQVSVGQSEEAAHAILRRDPVERPDHPEDPFASPLRELRFSSRTGEPVRIELYVVTARAAQGCPDVQIEDVPVVYLDGFVAGKTWAFVESHWRSWGGSLAALRAAQDRYRCTEPDSARALEGPPPVRP